VHLGFLGAGHILAKNLRTTLLLNQPFSYHGEMSNDIFQIIFMPAILVMGLLLYGWHANLLSSCLSRAIAAGRALFMLPTEGM
jgi:hypothetical protein